MSTTKTKHTPGPWAYNENTQRVETVSGYLIAENVNVPDCALVAAAPDLLEALERLVNAPLNRYEDARKVACQTIARARGES